VSVVVLLADHGDLVTVVPFVVPALLVVGVVGWMRLAERRRDDPSSR
jgi:hypothetical protein